MLELGLLGPVRAVRAGRQLTLGGPKQRAVLALLLVDAGRVVPADYLAEVLWRGTPPPGAGKTLRSYVSRLRSLLGPDATLTGRGGGYVITVGPDRVDAARFERLVGAGRDALSRGEAAAAAGRFAEALALWRGRALADVAEVEPLAREAARLEELRVVAEEGRIEADIERGLGAEVTGQLEQLVAGYPVRERLWRLLVLALYRAERQADALAAYRRARAVLAEELGIEPGEELRQLEGAVLRQEVPPLATGVGVQGQVKLAVGETARQPVGRVHRERGLADPGHPADRADPHNPTAGGQAIQFFRQLIKLGPAAGEAGDIPRQPAGRCRGERPQGRPPPGRHHVLGAASPARRGHEQLCRRLRQAKRLRQQYRGLLAGGPVNAPLQVTDRARAKARRFRQLLLRQPGFCT